MKCLCGNSPDDTGLKTCTSTLESSHLKHALVLEALTRLVMSNNNNNNNKWSVQIDSTLSDLSLVTETPETLQWEAARDSSTGHKQTSQERGGFDPTPFPQPWGSESVNACQVRFTNLLKHHWRQMPTQRLKPRPAGGWNVNSVSVPMIFSRFKQKEKKKKKHQPYGCCSLPVPAYKNKTPPLYYLWHGCLISTKCCRW